MEVVKAFTTNNLHTEILIKGTMATPLFRASDVGEILEIVNIRASIQHFDNTEKYVDSVDSTTGPKQVTFLTEKGLYKLLFRSRKPIAEKFQDWVCEVVREIRLNGVYEFEKKIEHTNNKLIEVEQQLYTKQCLEREKTLLEKFAASGCLIYIIKVKTFTNGTYVIKIGESRRGIRERYNDHKYNYDECLLLDCFSVQRSKDFESFIHHHKSIRPHKFAHLQGHENENELFLIGRELTYQHVINIIRDNIDNYNHRVSELLLKNELLEQEIMQLKNGTSTNDNAIISQLLQSNQELVKTNQELVKRMSSIENILMNHPPQNTTTSMSQNIQTQVEQPRQSTLVTGFGYQKPSIGPRLQKINPETMQLVKVYETVSDAMYEDKNIKRPSIMKAANENTVYNGFRWFLVERNTDANVLQNIPPTKETLQKNPGYIAKLNKEKSEILAVYLDRKTASLSNGYQTASGLDNPVKNRTMSNNHYYMLYSNCDEDVIAKFEEKHGVPLLYKDGVGQFDENGQMIQEFSCKYDCIRELRISDKTLAKTLDKDVQYNGCYYKSLGSKLQMP